MSDLRKALTGFLLLLLLCAASAAQEAPLFALQWSDPSNPALFEYQTAMVRLGESGWISMLKRHPEGRRAIIVTHPHNSIWNDEGDRCRDANGSLAGLSASPTGSMFKNATGGDGLPSGYSCPWLDSWIEHEKPRNQARVDQLRDGGVDLNYLLFDVESKIDWLKLNKGWRAAIMADPRWAKAQPVLDSLKKVATGDPAARFDFEGGTEDGHAWNAYMWAQQARALNEGIFNVFKAAYPNLKGSNYEHHARRADDTTLETYGWHFYQMAVTGTHSSDYYYGWLIQVEDAAIGTRILENKSDWLTFLFEQRKARASVRTGYPIEPWICYSGNKNIDWRTAVRAPALHTPNPFWEENIRHLLMLEADPLLYWNSRTYSKDDHSTDEIDGFVEKLLAEVNAQIGVASPRYTVTSEPISWAGYTPDRGLDDRQAQGDGLIATGLRHGSEVTYRVAAERVTNDPATWESVKVRVLRNGTDTGARVVIPAGETGAYYTTPFREGDRVTFDFVPQPVANLLGTLDLTGGSWGEGDGTTLSATTADECPVAGVPVTRLYAGGQFSVYTNPVTLKGGHTYTFSAYLKGLSSSTKGGVGLKDDKGNTLAAYSAYNRDRDGWGRFSVTYRPGADQVVIPYVSAYRQLACAPALNEGGTAGFVSVDGPPPGPPTPEAPVEQHIRLRQGVNLVAFHVDPGNVSPDSVLGAHEAVSLVQNAAGEGYSTRFDIREITTWDARTAYRILVDEPVEIVLKGRPLHVASLDLEAGWNLVPYANSTPADLAALAEQNPDVLLRVEDDGGRVFEPGGENVTLHSFEPGRAYRIYAGKAARIALPN